MVLHLTTANIRNVLWEGNNANLVAEKNLKYPHKINNHYQRQMNHFKMSNLIYDTYCKHWSYFGLNKMSEITHLYAYLYKNVKVRVESSWRESVREWGGCKKLSWTWASPVTPWARPPFSPLSRDQGSLTILPTSDKREEISVVS